MMKLREFLFGRGERESERKAIGTTTWITGHQSQKDVLVIVERNTKTGKRRAFSEDFEGTRNELSIDWVDANAPDGATS